MADKARTDSFKQKYASTYTSKYSSEPASRPAYIPSSYAYNNRSYNVVYDRSYGGYGYYVGSRWYYYDAFTDAVVLSSLMNHHSYYYGSGYNGYYGGSNAVVVDNTPTNGWDFMIFICVLGGIVVLAIVFSVVANRTR